MSEQSSPYYAALDLGSNSFHLLIVQRTENGIQELDKIKHMVRLGEGLGEGGALDDASIRRALDALTEMGQRISHIPDEQVRAVGTNTMRVASNGEEFLSAAQAALGKEIEIISGQEEARLIYLGITEHNHFKDHNLVIDIGGGSTEVIVGDGSDPQVLRSMKMGCANMANRFFSKGKISKSGIKKALAHVGKTIEPHIRDIMDYRWQRAILSSGTAKNVERALQKLGLSERGVSRENLNKLLEVLQDIGKIDKLGEKLGIDEERAYGFTGGVCILTGLYNHLNIDEALVSQQALREGVLLDLMGYNSNGDYDERNQTVIALQQRFNIDKTQAARVCQLANHINRHLPLTPTLRVKRLLDFAAELHEIGLAVARSKYQNHGAYLMANADMPGFSRAMQQVMSVLVKGQRKKLPGKYIAALPAHFRDPAWQFTLALRIAVLLCRARIDIDETDYPEVAFKDNTLTLTFRNGFLENRPLTVSDLLDEQGYWSSGSSYELAVALPGEE